MGEIIYNQDYLTWTMSWIQYKEEHLFWLENFPESALAISSNSLSSVASFPATSREQSGWRVCGHHTLITHHFLHVNPHFSSWKEVPRHQVLPDFFQISGVKGFKWVSAVSRKCRESNWKPFRVWDYSPPPPFPFSWFSFFCITWQRFMHTII